MAALAEALAEAGCGATMICLLRARPEELRRRLSARSTGLLLFIDHLRELVTLSESW